MNKILTITITLFLLFTLTGCTLVSKDVSEDEVSQDSEYNQEVQEETGVVESVIGALSKNRVLKCIYVDDDGDKTPVYIKGDKVYAIGVDDDGKENDLRGLVTNDKYYIWSLESNEGAYVDLTDDSEDGIKMNGKRVRNSKEIIELLERDSQTCEYATIDNSVFELPDLEFSLWD